jgi:hypothetical protein
LRAVKLIGQSDNSRRKPRLYSKSLPAEMPREDFRLKRPKNQGFGLAVVVVVVDSVVVSVLTDGVEAVSAGVGFTLDLGLAPVSLAGGGVITVMGVSVFVSAGVTSVFCSHAPRSVALARMQNNFFIVWIGCPS